MRCFLLVQLWALQERLMKGSGDSDKSERSFPELMAQLSTQPPKKLDQVKALGIASEAFKGIHESLHLYIVFGQFSVLWDIMPLCDYYN